MKTTNSSARPLRILLIVHSLSGETNTVVKEFAEGLVKGVEEATTSNQSNTDDVDSDLPPSAVAATAELTMVPLRTSPPFEFPWSFYAFFDIMPETIFPSLNKVWNTSTIEPPPPSVYDKNDKQFDLVILGWQTWYLSPSLPVRLAMLYSPEYQTLLRQAPVLLLGTHRNMWHRASRTIRRELEQIVGTTVVGRVDFVQQAPFLHSVYNTVRWQLGGTKGSGGVKETVQDQAFLCGMEYGRKLEAATRSLSSTANASTRAAALGWYEAGEPHRYAVELTERLWLPIKWSVASLMGKFRPGSWPRKLITLIYSPVILVGIVLFGTPTVVIGSCVETFVRQVYKSACAAVPCDKKQH